MTLVHDVHRVQVFVLELGGTEYGTQATHTCSPDALRSKGLLKGFSAVQDSTPDADTGRVV